MRLATFNLESLHLPPKAKMPLEVRAEVLKTALERLQADVLCLQVNGQRVHGRHDRALMALDQLLCGTHYASNGLDRPWRGRCAQFGDALALFHPCHRELLHHLVDPPRHQLITTDTELPAGAEQSRSIRVCILPRAALIRINGLWFLTAPALLLLSR